MNRAGVTRLRGGPEAGEPAGLVVDFISALGSARNGMSATRPVICCRLTIYAVQQQSSDDMKLPEFLPLPKIHRRARSKARSEIGPIGGPGDADPGVPHPTESTPDLGISVSALPPSSPSTPRDQKANGMQNALSRRPV